MPGKFRVEEGEPDYLLSVTTVPELAVPMSEPVRSTYNSRFYMEEGREVQIIRFEKDHAPFVRVEEPDRFTTTVQIKESYLSYYCWTLLLSLLRIPERVMEQGATFLHSSFVNRNGEALLFTAKKQTGKSTQAALWNRYRGTETANGDRALLFEENGQWFAASTPFAGTSRISENRILPLKAVVVLDRAENINSEKPVIEKAGVQEAVRALLDGCTFRAENAEDVEKILSMSERLIEKVPFWKLYATMDEASVQILEGKL